MMQTHDPWNHQTNRVIVKRWMKDTVVLSRAFRRYSQLTVNFCSIIYFHRILDKYLLLSVYLTCVHKTEWKRKPCYSVDNIFELKKKQTRSSISYACKYSNYVQQTEKKSKRRAPFKNKINSERTFPPKNTHFLNNNSPRNFYKLYL